MIIPGVPLNEPGRIADLRSYHILDSGGDPLFDNIAALAARMCGVNYCIINFIDSDRHWLKVAHGLKNFRQIPRETGFCSHLIVQGTFMQIPDLTMDDRFSANPLVTLAPHFRFYAGVPLLNERGHALGTLVVLETEPRELNEWQIEALQQFAQVIIAMLEAKKIDYQKHYRDQRFSLIVNNSLDAYVMIDAEGFIEEWNQRAEQLFGWKSEEVIGRPWVNTVMPQLPADDPLTRQRSAGDGRAALNRRIETMAQHKNGLSFPIELSLSSIHFDGRAIFSASIRDISERKRMEFALKESEDRFRSTFELASVGIIHVGLDGTLSWVNRKFCAILGHSEAELVKHSIMEFTYSADVVMTEGVLRGGENGHQDARSYEKRYIRKDGNVIWVLVNASLRRDADGKPLYFISVIEDITERKVSEQKIEYLATHDPLTKLPNRNLLHDRIEHALAHAHSLSQSVVIMFLDIDRFKLINDTLGHNAGDTLLKTMAKRLLASVRDGDTVSRLGGDEFVIVLEDIHRHPDAARRVAQNLLESVRAPIELEGHEIVVSTSIGVAVYPADGTSVDTLLKHADMAMYQAKEHGRNNFQFYGDSTNGKMLQRLLMENGLRRALEKNEFVLHYQPLIQLASGRITGVEALIRWNHPEQGMIAPTEFIGLAEDVGLIIPIGAWVLEEVCRQIGQWYRAGVPPVRVSINLSAHQLRSPGLTMQFMKILDSGNANPDLLEFEITETSAMQETVLTMETLEAFRDYGIRISIDDFGTGYSSLSHLKKLPIDTLKIDASFIRDIAFDADDAAIVTATVAMAHSMQLKVVAEGVETEAQRSFLATLHCDEMQGFLFSKPLPAEGMAAYLQAQDQVLANCH